MTSNNQRENDACPCEVAESPCTPNCTCANPLLSGGCFCCCRYGSLSQRRDRAKLIIETMHKTEQRNAIYADIDAEIVKADKHQHVFSSLHEAYSMILEEVDELWDIVRLKRKNRCPVEVRKELVQIAAMAIKGLHSMDNFTGGSP